jgi:DNA-3-methyladenine glycosylase II
MDLASMKSRLSCAMTRLFLPVPKEFSYAMNYQFLERSPRELLHHAENGTVTKLLKVEDQKVLFSIHEGDEKLIVNFLNGIPSASARNFVKCYIREWFDLETDLKPFYQFALKDKLLNPLVKKYYGYRIMGQPDLFESIVWAVLGQQINLQFAYTLKQRFVEQFGERLFFHDQSWYLFPDAKLVSELKDEVLLPLQFSRQKSRYTIGIAEAFASGEMSKEKLRGLPLQEAKEKLIKIKGIGNWTANYALMKTFRYPDAFPLEDAGVHNAIKNLKKMNRKPTLHEVKRLFKKYKGWEAYATLYLWKSL